MPLNLGDFIQGKSGTTYLLEEFGIMRYSPQSRQSGQIYPISRHGLNFPEGKSLLWRENSNKGKELAFYSGEQGDYVLMHIPGYGGMFVADTSKAERQGIFAPAESGVWVYGNGEFEEAARQFKKSTLEGTVQIKNKKYSRKRMQELEQLKTFLKREVPQYFEEQ